MTTLVPPPLRPGDRVAVVAPGGPPRRAALLRGIAWLEQRQFVVDRGAHVLDRRGYLAGDDAGRADDLNRAFADPGLKAVWFARGGYGSQRILPRIDFSQLRSHPKALIGYSDVTVLQAAAWRFAGLSTLHGPMVAELADSSAYDATSLARALSGAPVEFALPRRTVLRAGRGEGPIVGGCLSLLVGLIGTPFDLETRGAILFWEDVNEEPYRIDRMLAHLRLAGRLHGLQGMVIGRLPGCRARRRENDIPLADILKSHLQGTDYPVVVDFPAGHARRKVTLPLGRAARLDTFARRLAIDGAANAP
ncbi:MAG TPA: LD-carboxypeptidase [Candidatus Cryosericum sp.]|nr:LD-carboxypeptidase [Candidatus Cryosericum sp.]